MRPERGPAMKTSDMYDLDSPRSRRYGEAGISLDLIPMDKATADEANAEEKIEQSGDCLSWIKLIKAACRLTITHFN